MHLAEVFVTYVQRWIPTWLLQLLCRWWMMYVGPKIRGGGVVVRQIKLDRGERAKKPVTTMVAEANEQLYANDPAFFCAHLGPRYGPSLLVFWAWTPSYPLLGKAQILLL